MAPISYPPAGKQTFQISGESSFTLTEAQRKARSLLITVEKVKTGFVYDYFNFSTPEPNTHWGYLQLMAKDFVIETQQLEYRRQVVKFWDHIDLDPIEQLRCLVRKVAKFMFDLGIELSPVELPENAQEILLLELFEADIAHPRIVPGQLLTSIWYKIDEGRAAFVTIDWEGYALNNCEFAALQQSPQGNPPARGESGPGGAAGTGDGGGTRDPAPPPSDQQGDPGSDSPGPTSGSNVPPSPGPLPPPPPSTPGRWRVEYENRVCAYNASTAKYFMQVTPGSLVGRGPYLMLEKTTGGSRTFYLKGSDGTETNLLSSSVTPDPACPERNNSVILNQFRLSD